MPSWRGTEMNHGIQQLASFVAHVRDLWSADAKSRRTCVAHKTIRRNMESVQQSSNHKSSEGRRTAGPGWNLARKASVRQLRESSRSSTTTTTFTTNQKLRRFSEVKISLYVVWSGLSVDRNKPTGQLAAATFMLRLQSSLETTP